MKSISLKSPAKVNLFLNVLSRRPDGYHNIETLFERVDLCDEVILSKSKNGINIICDNTDVPADENNLIYKAVKSLQARLDVTLDVEIVLKKNIPVAGGLGGGSGNAATALMGLNNLFDLGLNRADLIVIGRKLGADVPFFLIDESFAIGTEIGDALEPVPCDLKLWHVMVSPALKVPTKDIYARLDLNLTEDSPDVKILITSLKNGDLDSLKRQLYNRLQSVILKEHKEVRKIKSLLSDIGLDREVLVSGSGPTIFFIAKNREEAMSLKEKAENIVSLGEGTRVFVASTL